MFTWVQVPVEARRDGCEAVDMGPGNSTQVLCKNTNSVFLLGISFFFLCYSGIYIFFCIQNVTKFLWRGKH